MRLVEIMADCKFETKLKSFLKNDTIHRTDFTTYISTLRDLAERVEEKTGFNVYAPVVKSWIAEFETIFCASKIDGDAQTFWRKLSKFCSSITKTYLSLLQSFHQFEPNYTQELYVYWGSIVSPMNGLTRAASFITNTDEFKIVIQHLRTAEQRCEQFSILSVLVLYIENVPIADLDQLKENDNAQIVDKIVQLMQMPTTLNKHRFLHDIHSSGHSIESLKPKRIFCDKLRYDNSEHEIWMDFNKKNKSISFITVSLSNNDHQMLAVGGHVKLRENFYDDHMFEINGVWNIMVNTSDAVQKKLTVKVFLLDEVQTAISKSVRNTFRFVKPASGGSMSQDFHSDNIEQGHVIDDSNIESPAVSRKALHGLERSESRITLPVLQKPSCNFNLSLPLLAAQPNEMNSFNNIKTVEERLADCNQTYVLRQSVDPIAFTNDKVKIVEPSTDQDAYVVRKTVNPIARQSENDRMLQDKIDKKPFNADETYTIGNCALSDISQNMPIVDNRLMDDDPSSGISCADEMSFGEDEKYGDSENDVDMQDYLSESESDANYLNYWKLANKSFGEKKIQVIEDIMIVPPTIPMGLSLSQYLQSTGSVQFLQFSQTEETVSASRRDTFNAYSQPMTSHEKCYVKDSSNPWQRVKNPQLDEPIKSSSRKPIDFSNRSTRKRSQTAVSFSQDFSQKKFKLVDRSIQLSPERLQRTQEVPQIGYLSQNQSDHLLQNSVEMSCQVGNTSSRDIERNLHFRTQQSRQPTASPKSMTQRTLKSLTRNESQEAQEVPSTQTSHSSQSPYDHLSQNPVEMPCQAANTSSRSIERSLHIQTQQSLQPTSPPNSTTQRTSKSLTRNESQQYCEVPSNQISYSYGNDTFVPLANSTQRTSKSQASHLSQNRVEKPSQAAHTSSRSIQRSLYPKKSVQPPSQEQVEPTATPKSMTQRTSTSQTRNESQQSREEPSTQIGYSSQSQYETFVPIATSTQRTSNSQTNHLSQCRLETSFQGAQSRPFEGSMTQRRIESIIPAGSVAPKTSDSIIRNKSQSQSKLLSRPDTSSKMSRYKNSQERTANKTRTGSSVQPTTSATQKALKILTQSSVKATERRSQLNKPSQNRVSSDSCIESFTPEVLDLHASLKQTTSSTRNSSHKKDASFIQQNAGDAGAFEIFELPVVTDASQKVTTSTQKRTKMTEPLPLITQRKVSSKISSRKPLHQIVNVDTLGKSSPASRASKKPSQNRTKPTAAPPKKTKRKSENRSSVKNKVTTSATQKSNPAVRYSSLKRSSKAVSNHVTRPSETIFLKTNRSDRKISNNTEDVATHSVLVDDSGRVYDDQGCVFADNSELQRAAKFYIDNHGLEYMKTESFKALDAGKRDKYERKLRTIREMMHRGLETLHHNDNQVFPSQVDLINTFDPYQLPYSETVVQGRKLSRMRSTKKVKRITVSKSGITITRRVSKLWCVVDDGPSNNLTSMRQPSKTSLKKFKKFDKPVPIKKKQPTVNFNFEKSENRPKEETKSIRSERDKSPSNLSYPLSANTVKYDQASVAMSSVRTGATNAPKRLPIYATAEKMTQHQFSGIRHEVSSTVQSNRTAEIGQRKLPIYATSSYQKKVISATMERKCDQPLGNSERSSAVIDCGDSVSSDECYLENINENCTEVCIPRRDAMENEFCSTKSCNKNLKDLVCGLKKMANDPATGEQQKRILVKFFDRLHPT